VLEALLFPTSTPGSKETYVVVVNMLILPTLTAQLDAVHVLYLEHLNIVVIDRMCTLNACVCRFSLTA